MPISSPYTSVFKRIRILDSTAFQLPDVFSSVYPSAGGCSHTAGIKFQESALPLYDSPLQKISTVFAHVDTWTFVQVHIYTCTK